MRDILEAGSTFEPSPSPPVKPHKTRRRQSTPTTPKAIETHYAGARFRSRLEARWAVFFDALALPWEYEPEGFELPYKRDSVRGVFHYLPDFWLPTLEAYLEVKPTSFNATEHWDAMCKMHLLRLATGRVVLIALGPPETEAAELSDEGWGTMVRAYLPSDIRDNRVGPPAPLPDETAYLIGTRGHIGLSYPRLGWKDLVDAANAARSARFEFGESG